VIYQSTSREAFERIKPVSGFLDSEIMRALRDHPDGITCQAIEAYIGRDHQAVSGNLRHLVERGYAAASGRFGLTKSGRKAILWVEFSKPAFKVAPDGQLEMF